MAFTIVGVFHEPKPWTSFNVLMPQTFPPGFRVTLAPPVAPLEGDHALAGMKALLSSDDDFCAPRFHGEHHADGRMVLYLHEPIDIEPRPGMTIRFVDL